MLEAEPGTLAASPFPGSAYVAGGLVNAQTAPRPRPKKQAQGEVMWHQNPR